MKKKQRLLYLFLFILLIIGTGFLLNHPAFRIKTFYCEGQNFIPSDTITKHTLPYRNFNLFYVRYISDLKSDLKNAYPQIEKVKFKFKFPDGLTLHIIEKKPWVSFLVTDKTLWISQDGTVLNEGNNSPTLTNIDTLLIIRGLGPEFFTRRHINEKLFLNIKNTIGTIHHYFPNNENLQLEFKHEELELLKNDTMRIKLGSFDKLETKVKMLATFLASVPSENQQHIQYIDLRIPPKVIVKDAN